MIHVCYGTQAELIKLAPVLLELARRGVLHRIIDDVSGVPAGQFGGGIGRAVVNHDHVVFERERAQGFKDGDGRGRLVIGGHDDEHPAGGGPGVVGAELRVDEPGKDVDFSAWISAIGPHYFVGRRKVNSAAGSGRSISRAGPLFYRISCLSVGL